MQNDKTYFKTYPEIVSALATTRTEVNMLLSELDLLTRSLYMVNKGNFTEVMETGIRAKTALSISQLVNEKNREQVLNGLRDAINLLNYLGLTIAFEPNMEIISKLNTWVKQNVGPNVALDITIDKSILGGAVIEYNGRIFSSTIQTKVKDYFINNNVNV